MSCCACWSLLGGGAGGVAGGGGCCEELCSCDEDCLVSSFCESSSGAASLGCTVEGSTSTALGVTASLALGNSLTGGTEGCGGGASDEVGAVTSGVADEGSPGCGGSGFSTSPNCARQAVTSGMPAAVQSASIFFLASSILAWPALSPADRSVTPWLYSSTARLRRATPLFLGCSELGATGCALLGAASWLDGAATGACSLDGAATCLLGAGAASDEDGAGTASLDTARGAAGSTDEAGAGSTDEAGSFFGFGLGFGVGSSEDDGAGGATCSDDAAGAACSSDDEDGASLGLAIGFALGLGGSSLDGGGGGGGAFDEGGGGGGAASDDGAGAASDDGAGAASDDGAGGAASLLGGDWRAFTQSSRLANPAAWQAASSACLFASL